MTPDAQSMLAAKILGYHAAKQDRMISEDKVFSWRLFDGNGIPRSEFCASEEAAWNIVSIPAFDTDAKAALMLVDWMAKNGWFCELANGLDYTWECSFMRARTAATKPEDISGERELHYIPAQTLPLAILGAFIRAKGKEIE